MNHDVKITECPRDAMQGIKNFIPTELKAKYINALLKVNFDVLDFGSFVSPKVIPQMKDTADVLKLLDLSNSNTKLLSIVANNSGATKACAFDEISILGFPFSISETFQLRNTNSTIEESLKRVEFIQNLCEKKNKTLLVYISMGFGNPYNDPWNTEIVWKWTKELSQLGIKVLSFADTIGVSNPEKIKYVFENIVPEFPEVEFGAHLHTAPHNWQEKIEAAYNSGCRRFDGALKGYGGCPMAEDKLVGNMPTENMIEYFTEKNVGLSINKEALVSAFKVLPEVFSH